MSASKKPRRKRDISPTHPNAAAIDIVATMHVAAVGPDQDPEPVRSFGTFTGDFYKLADWFEQCGVRTVAMESTGVYWIPVFEILDQRGFEVILVNARDAKHVPGRKTDISDAQWLQRLHEYGLLRASFRLKGEVAIMRAYLRQRERLLDYAASHIQHMQKALTQMNLQLHHVVTDITGTTGMAIIRAIVAGERDPAVLAANRKPRCHSSLEKISEALVGNHREEHIFALTQALELYDVYQAKVALCDLRIEAVLKRLRKASSAPVGKLPPVRATKKQANDVNFDVRTALHGLLGCDVTQIHGLGPYLALKLVGECGTNLSLGRMPSTSPPGCVSRQATKSPEARSYPHEPDDLAVAPQPCCGLPRSVSDARRPRWGHSTGACPRALAKPRRSPPRPAKSLSSSIIPCVMASNTATREPPTTRSVTADASSAILSEGPSRWGMSYKKHPRRRDCFLGIPRPIDSFARFAFCPVTVRLATEVNMKLPANDTDQQNPNQDDREAPSDLAVIRDQTSESLQILRSLLSIMLPKADGDGPKLEDLIAALVAQQRDILAGVARLQSDMDALYERLDSRNGADRHGGLAG
jgi:hypothetical protein